MDTAPLAVGTMLKGRYRITRLVGGGGMAWVYQVQEHVPGQAPLTWALKELRSDSEDTASLQEAEHLFAQEAQILVRLSHPNLPQVSAYFQDSGRSYLAMEFIHGESLAKKLELANAPLLETLVLDWAIQICTVLDYLHSQPDPIIFRDMKPSNVMVTLEGRVKLIDFGIARVYKTGKSRDTITMGSENYAAPEQWGKAQSDARADIYGLGATLYHLLTNMPPLPAFVPGARVPITQYNPAVSEGTVAVIDRALLENRDRRYASAVLMREVLLNCLPRRERRRIEQRAWAAPQAPITPRNLRPAAPVQAKPAQSTPARPAPATKATPRPTPQPGQSAGPQPAPRPQPTPMEQPAAPPQLTYEVCPSCGHANGLDARFCSHCGQNIRTVLPPILTLVEPVGARWEYPLVEGEILIGRPHGQLPVDLNMDYYDPEGYISRNHARLTRVQRRYQIVDLHSSNGTFVNGQRLSPGQAHWLRQGDQIRMGRVVLELRIR